MKQILKGKRSLFTVFFLFLSLFSFAEKKSYTEVITSDPMVEKGLSVSVGKKIGIWRPPTEKKELPTDRKVTLEDLVDHALTYNAELGQLRAEVNQAKIGVMGAKSNYFPKIDFSASMSWFLNPLDDIRLKQGELGIVEIPNVGSIMLPLEDYKLYDGQDDSYYRFVFTLEQPIFTWGKIPAAVKLYREVARAAELKCARKERELEASINGYYFSLYYLNRISDSLREQMKYSDRLLTLTRSSYENGFITLTDFQDVQTKIKDVQIADSRVKDSFNMIRYKLTAALGGTAVDLNDIDFTGCEERLAEFETNDWMKTLDEYIDMAKASSVEMDLLRAQVGVYEHKYEVAKADSYLKPQIGAQIQAGFSGTAFPFIERGWFTSGSPVLSASIGIKSRILDGGDRLSSVMTGEQELASARYQMQSGEFSIESTVSTLYSNIEYNYTNIAYLKDQEANYQRLADRQRIRYNAGQLREIDYLRSLIEYQTSLISTANERITLVGNYFQLMYLIDNVGGKTEPVVSEETADEGEKTEENSEPAGKKVTEVSAASVSPE
ncbi:MAG: TolC family protein [Spirochaetia bacterium]|nr:TolC family protein [Spirochaetia bacterium]